MELLPTLLSTGWASGVNAYATVALLGILGRLGFGDVPEPLTENPVIAAASVMYAIEFVTDKIPYVDNTWDLLHTAIRPAIGSALGIEFADLDAASAVAGGAGTGGLALVSHGVKSGLRLAVNTSPEPLSNIVVSTLEDLAVAGVVVLALEHPVPAAVIAMTLLVAGVVLVILLFRVIRSAYRRWRDRRDSRSRGP
jgi:hypothetical protein